MLGRMAEEQPGFEIGRTSFYSEATLAGMAYVKLFIVFFCFMGLVVKNECRYKKYFRLSIIDWLLSRSAEFYPGGVGIFIDGE